MAEPFNIEMGCGGCTWDIPRWKYNGTRGPVAESAISQRLDDWISDITSYMNDSTLSMLRMHATQIESDQK